MIDEKRIERNHQEFCFPRRYGTDSEKLAFEKIKQKIEMLNLRAKSQLFTFTTFYSNILLKIYVFLISMILLFKYLGVADEIFISFLSVIVFISLILFLISRNPENIKFGKKLISQNLFIKLNSEKEDNIRTKKKKLIFMAHVDSKGQTIFITHRVLSYYIWIASILFLVIVFLLRFILQADFFLLFHIIASILMIINFIASTLILINISNNKSDGALDNATGISIILELLHHFRSESIQSKKYDFWFLFTGAEECGTMGARVFLKSLQKFDKNDFIIINFDTIGNEIDLFKFGSEKTGLSKISDLIFESARENDLEMRNSRKVIGVHSDGWIAAKKRFNGIGFGNKNSYKYVHKLDTIDKVNYRLLYNFCKVITTAVKELDNN